jgi:hypothetical protein
MQLPPGSAATRRVVAATMLALVLVACGGARNVEARVTAWENERNAEYGVRVTDATCRDVEHGKTYSCDLSYSNGTVATRCYAYFDGGDFLGIDRCLGGTYVEPWTQLHSEARDAAADCLSRRGADGVSPLRERRDLDRVAADAYGAGLTAQLGSTPLTIAFAKSDADAAQLENEWESVLDVAGTSEDSIERHGRAVVHWKQEPTPEARATVATCLDSGQ